MDALQDAPAGLLVEYDLHGIRCQLPPYRPQWKVWWERLSLTLLFLVIFGFGVGAVGFTVFGDRAWALLLAGSALFLPVVLLFGRVDTSPITPRKLRLGEGWLVVRSSGVPELRIDLSQVVSCTVGPVEISLRQLSGEETSIPSGGLQKDEVLWLASAIERAVLDGRRDVPPPPRSLLELG